MTFPSKRRMPYSNLGYWFLFFIVLVIAGFYHSYFLIIFHPTALIIHIHFGLVMVWILMLISQPFLIKYKKTDVHRLVGRMSYVIVPLLLISCFLMMRHGYFDYLERMSHQYIGEAGQIGINEVRHQAAINFAMSFLDTLWLGLFYCLAILNKKHPATHARYIVAASLTLLIPTVNRIFFIALKIEIFPFHIPVETLAFLLIDGILIILLLVDSITKRNNRALSISLCIYVFGQIIYFIGKDTSEWECFMALMMNL